MVSAQGDMIPNTWADVNTSCVPVLLFEHRGRRQYELRPCFSLDLRARGYPAPHGPPLSVNSLRDPSRRSGPVSSFPSRTTT